jgi:hypothetical protein
MELEILSFPNYLPFLEILSFSIWCHWFHWNFHFPDFLNWGLDDDLSLLTPLMVSSFGSVSKIGTIFREIRWDHGDPQWIARRSEWTRSSLSSGVISNDCTSGSGMEFCMSDSNVGAISTAISIFKICISVPMTSGWIYDGPSSIS